jgi:hypothetical protein
MYRRAIHRSLWKKSSPAPVRRALSASGGYKPFGLSITNRAFCVALPKEEAYPRSGPRSLLSVGAPTLSLIADQALCRYQKPTASPSNQAVGARHGNDLRRRRNLILMFSVVPSKSGY